MWVVYSVVLSPSLTFFLHCIYLFQLKLITTIAFSSAQLSSARIAFISSLLDFLKKVGGRGEGKNGRVSLNLTNCSISLCCKAKFTHQHGIPSQKYFPEPMAVAVCWPKFSTLLNSAGDVGRYLPCQQFLSYWDHFIKHNSTPSVSTKIVNSDLNLVRNDICTKKITAGIANQTFYIVCVFCDIVRS